MTPSAFVSYCILCTLGFVAVLPPVAAARSNNDYLHSAPPIVPLAPTQIDVYPNGYQFVGGTFVAETGYPLLRAIEAGEALYAANQQTLVVEVHGVIPASQGQYFGGGPAGLKPYRCYWKNYAMDVAVRGATGPFVDEIVGFGLGKNLTNGTITPGVKLFRAENLSIRPGLSSWSVVSTPNGLPETFAGGVYPLLEIYGCVFHKGDGQPKWGARLNGRCRFDLRGNHFQYMKEHSAYIDSPQGDSIFAGNSTGGSTRTMLQVVNRSIENPGPSGHGYLLIAHNIATNIDGSGGSDFTVAGHLGVVIFRANVSLQGYWQTGSQGSVVVYTNENPAHGVHLNANGYSTNKVIMQRHFVFAPNADRDHVTITGAEEVEVRDAFLIGGNRIAFYFDETLYGGSIPNGKVCFLLPPPVSNSQGFLSIGDVRRAGKFLSGPEIDALWCP